MSKDFDSGALAPIVRSRKLGKIVLKISKRAQHQVIFRSSVFSTRQDFPPEIAENLWVESEGKDENVEGNHRRVIQSRSGWK